MLTWEAKGRGRRHRGGESSGRGSRQKERGKSRAPRVDMRGHQLWGTQNVQAVRRHRAGRRPGVGPSLGPLSKAFWKHPGCESAASAGVFTRVLELTLGPWVPCSPWRRRRKVRASPLAAKACGPLTGPHGPDLGASQAQVLALPSLPDMSYPPTPREFCPPLVMAPGHGRTTLSVPQLLQARHSYHGAWGARRARGPRLHYDLGLGKGQR